MIRFTCENCGQKIRTSDEFAGKRAKCPKCKSGVVIPVLESSASNKATSDNVTKSLADKSDAEITRELLGVKARRVSRGARRSGRRSWLRPHYDEVTLFSMSITFVLLLMISGTMRGDLYKLLFYRFDARVVVLAVLILAGIPFSIFHAFSTRQKHLGEKAAMMLFAIFVSAGTGIYAGIHMLTTSTGWLIVFPIWNVTYGVLLLLMFRMRLIDTTCISDKDATCGQVMLGLIAVLIIVICCQFFFRLHWAITFSICIAYTTSLDKAVQSVFGQK
jgi:cation transport ATPase